MKKRGRELGLPFGGVTGLHNAITDVPGVEVGYVTLSEGEGALQPGVGPIRTGVTVILPRGKARTMHPVWAGVHRFNGNGEMTGTHWIEDAGYFLSPVCITNTHSVGMVHHAVTKWMIRQYREAFYDQHLFVMPVVAETFDGKLNDVNGQHVREEHVFEALSRAAGGPVAEGNVGGGTGMVAYGFKGGTGTSSRKLDIDGHTYHVGVLVQANYGMRDRLTILGVPVGRHMQADSQAMKERGSVIAVIATDVPLLPTQLQRVARRGTLGIGRTGTFGGNGSGDLFLAFSVANRMDVPQSSPAHLQMRFINDEWLDLVYEAVCDAVDESVVNAMLAAETTSLIRPTQHDDAAQTIEALDHEQLLHIMRRYGRV